MSALEQLKGVGQKTLQVLHDERLFSCEDMVRRFPKKYDERFYAKMNQAFDGHYHYLMVTVETPAKVAYIRRNLQILSFYVICEDEKYLVKVYNQRFLARIIKKDIPLVLLGRPDGSKNEITASKVWLHKHFEEAIHPVYRMDAISDKMFSKLVAQCLDMIHVKKDFLPTFILEKYRLMPYDRFLREVHRPSNREAVRQIMRRLKYEELFTYQLKVQLNRYLNTHEKGASKTYDSRLLKPFIEALPFTLTESQKTASQEILSDLKKPMLMQRMLQGDTGSGKTVVACLAMIAVMSAGYQVAFMAPTEILAEQQYDTVADYGKHMPYEISLLTGNTPKSERNAILAALKAGTLRGVVGTHALFSDDVVYDNLGLVITDEQHRFGVKQRDALRAKGIFPDVLYLSATPIPRTLAMTLFGDMDVSTLESHPGQVKKTRTRVVSYKDKPYIRETMLETLKKGEQIYIVAPTIDDAEDDTLKGVKTIFNTIVKRYKDARVGLLHGKMTGQEKNETLRAFKQGTLDILVSTTVIEVGIHAPRASLMIVYHAERFGFAQLHQLRGRVGRSGTQGLCLLIHDDGSPARDRLKTMEQVYDGFVLSEHDLKHRGFGDLIGVMQSGHKAFEYADSKEDFTIMTHAKKDALEVIKQYESKKQHKTLIEHIKKHIEPNHQP